MARGGRPARVGSSIFTFLLDDEQKEKLIQIGKERNMSLAELIREGVGSVITFDELEKHGWGEGQKS
jgi:hypothetical protein